MKNLLSTRPRQIVFVLSIILLILVIAVTSLFFFFRTHALPGAKIGEISVGGQTQAALAQTLKSHQADQQVQLTVLDADPQPVVLAEAGVKVDEAATVDQVLAASRSVSGFLRGLFGTVQIEPVVTVDDAAFGTFADSLIGPEQSGAVDAAAVYDPDSGTFFAKEAQPGQTVDRDALRGELERAAQSLQPASVTAPVSVQDPAITTEAATAAVQEANHFLTAELTLNDNYPDSTSPDHDTRVSWIEFKQGDDGYHPTLKADLVTKWAQDFADETTDQPVNGLRNVDASGNVVATSLPAEDGYGVNNVAEVAPAFEQALRSSSDLSFDFTYDDLPATWTDRPALPGTEDWIYRPAEGEKWLDLNLTNATVTAYEGTDVVGGPWYMVPGEPRTPTVDGEFNVYLKYELQDMRGENVDGSKYLTEDVPWVTYFHGGYAFHGAPWRSSFGWTGPGGSHGCVNMQPVDAKFIYDWADMGTKVVSHY